MNRRVKITEVVKKIINDRYLFLAMLSPTRWVGERPREIWRGRTTNERVARREAFSVHVSDWIDVMRISMFVSRE